MNNMFYYFVAANLIMCKNLHKLLRNFLTNPVRVSNECTLIYSGSYGKSDLDKEYLYAAWLDFGRIVIIYEDRYTIGEVFFIFSYETKYFKLLSFGSKDYELYDPIQNKFKEEVYRKSAANYFEAIKPHTYVEFNIFFHKLFQGFWLSQLNFCGDLSNIFFDYAGYYNL